MSAIGIIALLIALPCVPMAAVFYYAIRRAYRSKSPRRLFLLYPLICSVAVTAAFLTWGYYAICTSKSAVAAIGFLAIAICSIVVAAAGFLVPWSVTYVVRLVIETLRGSSKRIASLFHWLSAVVLLALTGCVVLLALIGWLVLLTLTGGTGY